MGVNRKFNFRLDWKFSWDLSSVISSGNWLFRWDCVFSDGTCELWHESLPCLFTQENWTNKFYSIVLTFLFKEKAWHRCFPVNFAKVFGTSFLRSTSGRLLLNCVTVVCNCCIVTVACLFIGGREGNIISLIVSNWKH